ncbi:MAG: hypothetical protein ACE5Q6_24130 [Dehalococcoidia bacterium]
MRDTNSPEPMLPDRHGGPNDGLIPVQVTLRVSPEMVQGLPGMLEFYGRKALGILLVVKYFWEEASDPQPAPTQQPQPGGSSRPRRRTVFVK